MSSEPQPAPADAAKEVPQTKRFRPRYNLPLLPRDQVKRQGAISTLAFQLLGREQAIAFLNDDHGPLGGRPLALATASSEGLDRVEQELRGMAAGNAAAK